MIQQNRFAVRRSEGFRTENVGPGPVCGLGPDRQSEGSPLPKIRN